jgi:hypothetical protein
MTLAIATLEKKNAQRSYSDLLWPRITITSLGILLMILNRRDTAGYTLFFIGTGLYLCSVSYSIKKAFEK